MLAALCLGERLFCSVSWERFWSRLGKAFFFGGDPSRPADRSVPTFV